MASVTPIKDPTRLAPEDAYIKRRPVVASGGPAPAWNAASARVTKDHERNRSRSKRRNERWKKLLWVKQPYPDNYTDAETFLGGLQRNPRLIRYEFWSLVADSTVIVQQVCTVVIFVCCFVGIIQETISPVNVGRCGTAATVLCWLVWDIWVGRGLKQETSNRHEGVQLAESARQGLDPSPRPTHDSPRSSQEQTSDPADLAQPASFRNEQRLTTAKSAMLIYCALLGLSPVLKSLTESTSSDSIWAISFWLLCINIIFFDYSGGGSSSSNSSVSDAEAAPSAAPAAAATATPSFPASLSTNAAVMASTVLASRLPSTTHVFSLTLFSIQVFGLFPVFRVHLRRASRRAHFLLTALLVAGAGSGVAVCLSAGSGAGGDGNGGLWWWWPAAMLGAALSCALTGLAMGVCSWWLIGLQRYKNEIRGPWDPARPIIRRFD